MIVDKETEYVPSTSNQVSGSCPLAPLVVDEETLDLELQAAASEIELMASKFQEVREEDPDHFVMLVFPTEDPKPEEEEKEGDEEEEKEEAPQEKTWKDLLIACLPECPPPVCGILKEQLITFCVMVLVGLIFFLIYWFVE